MGLLEEQQHHQSDEQLPTPWDTAYSKETKDYVYGRELTWGRRLFRWLLLTQPWYQKYCGYDSVVLEEATSSVTDVAAAAEETTPLVVSKPSSSRPRRRRRGKRDKKPVRIASRFPLAKLDAAWAYYEHVTLPRQHIHTSSAHEKCGNKSSAAVDADHTEEELRRRAEPGERLYPTRLYHVWETKENELSDFGIGIGLYFYTLRCLSFIMFLAGLLSVPVLYYFAGPEYNGWNAEIPVWTSLHTSAICTDTKWVACPSCQQTVQNYNVDTTRHWFTFNAITVERYATANSTDDDLLYFLRNSECPVNHVVAHWSYATMIFVTTAVLLMQTVLLRRRARELDLAIQTAVDYSMEIENPPLDARDPEEWKNFLEPQFGHVTAVTVALDNENLVDALLKRRSYVAQLEQLIPQEFGSELLATGRISSIKRAVEVAEPVSWFSRNVLGTLTAEKLQEQIEAIEEQIKNDLALRTYNVSNVFVTFETEQSQQDALSALDVPGKDVWLQKASNTPLFRDKHVLKVREPPEPSSVRWKDLEEDWKVLFMQRAFTITMTILCMVAGFAVVTAVRYYGGITYAALTITALNSGAPTLFQYLVMTESHSRQGDAQSSLFAKNTGFLWFNTAIVSALITPFVRTLENTDDALIPAMMAVFITEMLKTPVTQLLDVYGQFQRFVLGPKAADQKRMNVYFQGTPWLLAERYTNMTTVLFLTFYFAVLFPAGYFFAAVTLAAHYWTDKYCLLRYWAPAPVVGTAVAKMSSSYFFLALAFYATMSAYNLASFPYDNACESDTSVSQDYIGQFVGISGDGFPVDIRIEAGDHEYFFCNQDMLRSWPPQFPPSPANQPAGSEWMTDEQEFAEVYAWTSFVIVACVVLIFFYNTVVQSVKNFFFVGKYKRRAAGSTKGFSEIEDISGYIPQATLAGDPFPVLLCDTYKIDRKLVGWDDPNEIFGEHSVIHDLSVLANGERGSLFSLIQHWVPPKKT